MAVASGVAAATLAALPLTVGYFKDELFFAAARRRPGRAGVAVLAAALTFAYIGRFWLGLFTGRPRGGGARDAAAARRPIAVLAAVALVGGVVVEPFAELAGTRPRSRRRAGRGRPAYHLDARAENVMAFAAWGSGRWCWWPAASATGRSRGRARGRRRRAAARLRAGAAGD